MHNGNAQKLALLTTLFITLLALSFPALANHGVDAIGAGLEILAVFMLIYMAILLTLCIINTYKKKTWLRAICTLMLTPILLISFYLFTILPPVGITGLVVLLIFGFLIYRSYPRTPVA